MFAKQTVACQQANLGLCQMDTRVLSQRYGMLMFQMRGVGSRVGERLMPVPAIPVNSDVSNEGGGGGQSSREYVCQSVCESQC